MVNLNTKLSFYNPEDALNRGIAPIKTQAQVVKESIDFVTRRAHGHFDYMRTSYKKLNYALGGGIEPNTIFTIGALSSGGKTTLGARICNSICSDPRNKKAIILNFNFEMLAHKQVGREICYLSDIDMKDLYNGNNTMTAERLQELIQKYYNEVMNYPILYVEEAISYKTIENTIFYYWERLCKEENITMVCMIDHAGIVRGAKESDHEKERIDGLMQGLNNVKKRIASIGGNAMYIVLSQMNREIYQVERKTNPTLHYPQTSDLFGASSMEFYSDYIMFTHNPSKLHLNHYTEFKYPIFLGDENHTNSREKPFIYWRIAKNREGELWDTIPMISRFERFDFEEVSGDDFQIYHDQFLKTGECWRIKTS